MGQTASVFGDFLMERLFGKTEARIVMIGLDAAGKTTILFKLRIGEVITTIPTIGFNVESVEYKSIKFTMWDIGGQDRLRPLWRRYYDNADAVIFVVDSCDQARLSMARDELSKMLSEETLRNSKVLVFANKQDMPNAMSPTAVSEALQLRTIAQASQEWYVQGCSATRGAGLYEGLDWLSAAVKRIKK